MKHILFQLVELENDPHLWQGLLPTKLKTQPDFFFAPRSPHNLHLIHFKRWDYLCLIFQALGKGVSCFLKSLRPPQGLLFFTSLFEDYQKHQPGQSNDN